MAGTLDPKRARPPGLTGSGGLAGSYTSSCTLLVQLAQNPQIDRLLRPHGLGALALMQAKEALGPRLPPEPADWAHRISTRGGRGFKSNELEQLLAILRSAESQGYRLMQRCGADLSTLRRQVIEALSHQQQSQTESAPARQSQRAVEKARLEHGNGYETGHHSGLPSGDRPGQPGLVASARRSSGYARQSQIESAPEPTPQRPVQEPPGPAIVAPFSPSPRPTPDLHVDRQPEPEQDPEPEPLRLEPLDPKDLGPLFGRDEVLQGLADAVSRERPRPPLLVGAHGSGRTHLVKQLAAVLSAPVYLLCAHQLRSESALSQAFHGIQAQGGVALLDDLDRVATEQSPDILPALADAWAQRKLRIVTVCSHETRARLEHWIPGILAGLDTILLPPLPDDAILPCVRAAAPEVLAQHGLELDEAQVDELAEQSCKLAQRYLSALAQPGRSIDLLDLAAARTVRLGQSSFDLEELRAVVAQRTGLAMDQVQGGADQELLDLEARIGERVVGHERAINRICGLIRRNRAGFRSERPIGSILLLGPSGIGKTEIAKALALDLFSQSDALLRLDMSEFSESHAVARIVGAPPGYVGHDHGGALADPMIEKPHRVVLLDEIEKAHRDVHQLLLQVLDEGRLTDGRGRTLDFRHALVIMTSNLGADLIAQSPRSKRPSPEPSPELRAAVQEVFPIELWNRIEAPLVLHPLDAQELAQVLDRLAQRSSDQLLAERDVSFNLTPSANKWLLELAGQDPELGARPLRHLLRRHIESALADALLSERIGAGMHVQIEWKRKTLHLRPRERA